MNNSANANGKSHSRPIWLAALVILLILGGIWLIKRPSQPPAGNFQTRVRLRLQWIPQAQFAGYLVAKELGYYSQAGLDVEIRLAGPDLKPQNTVAAGSDDIGIGVANQVIASRASGVPLVIFAQVFQDSANRYVLKKENTISSLKDLRGKKVGLWLGGDEAEFIAMLKTAGMTLDDVTVVPQGFTVAPFLNGEYVLSQVTTYNELNQIRAEGLTDDKLQIIAPGEYQAAIVSDMLFATEKYLKENRDTVQRFLAASLRGWKYSAENPEKAVDIILKFDKSLKRDEQVTQLREVLALVLSGPAKTNGIGYIDRKYYLTAERVLFDSKQISKRVDPMSVFEQSLWEAIPGEEKIPKLQ